MLLRLMFAFSYLLILIPISNGSTQINKKIAKEVVNKFEHIFPTWNKKIGSLGIAAIIVDNKSTLWQYIDGHTSSDKKITITPQTIFSLQSISKSFTALSVLIGEQKGIIKIDHPISSYLPEFKVNSIYEEKPENIITLKHLLSHYGGLTKEAPLGGNFDSRPHSFEEHILSIHSTWLKYPVGNRHSYSNLGIDLAGHILEKKMKKPFWKLVHENLFTPLQMKQTTFNIKSIIQNKNRAIGHSINMNKVKGGIPVQTPLIPSGGAYSSIKDMGKYLQLHLNQGRVNNQQILSQKQMLTMHSLAFPQKHQKSGAGLGIYRTHIKSTYNINHFGGGYGFSTFMMVYPELNIGFAFLINTDRPNFDLMTIINSFNEIVKKHINEKSKKSILSYKNLTPLNLSDKRIKQVLGHYSNNVSLKITNKKLRINIGPNFFPFKFYFDNSDKKITGILDNNSYFKFYPQNNLLRRSIGFLDHETDFFQYYDYHKSENTKDDEKGPNKTEWKKYLGIYGTHRWGRQKMEEDMPVTIENGYLNFSGFRCYEYIPGLFFTFMGEALDFRGTIPTYRNLILYKKRMLDNLLI